MPRSNIASAARLRREASYESRFTGAILFRGQPMARIWRPLTMVSIRERSLEELYLSDPERADALVFGRRAGLSRRGFLNGAGLTAMGAAVGGAIPFADRLPAGLVPAALGQGAPSAGQAAPKGPETLNFPGKDPGLVVFGDRPLVAETPEQLLDDETTPTLKFFIRNNGQIPESAADPDVWRLTV